MTTPRTMFDKIWDAHVVHAREDGQTLLFVDRTLMHDLAFRAFDTLAEQGRPIRYPELVFATPDHSIPTTARTIDDIVDPEQRMTVEGLEKHSKAAGIVHFDMTDPRHGIVHVVGPEQGITLPGILLVCGDSHTSTHGALGCIAFGIGRSELIHVLATQTLWQRKPKTMRVSVAGRLGFGVSGKDVILATIAKIGAGGGTGYAMEFAGPAIEAMSMEGRMTVCNMTIEAGARFGLVAPDEKTIAYVEGRPFAPKGADWKAAVAEWRQLPSDAGATYDAEIALDGAAIAPMVTWGNSPQDAVPVDGRLPDPAAEGDVERRTAMKAAYDYMALTPGMKVADIAVDKVFIGACTNSRIEDLRAAAAVAKGRKAVVPTLVVPGSGLVKAQAESEGLDRVFRDAGMEWREPGCSMCVAMNGDMLQPGERSASTSNRNFRGRQGPGGRTHLVSPATAAAAAVSGRFADVRDLLPKG